MYGSVAVSIDIMYGSTVSSYFVSSRHLLLSYHSNVRFIEICSNKRGGEREDGGGGGGNGKRKRGEGEGRKDRE